MYQQWRYGLDSTRYRNRLYPAMDERLPSPLVMDLDGDGQKEIVVATRSPSLVLLHAPNADDASGQPTVVRQVSLLGSTRSIGSRHPVAMSAGFLNPISTEGTVGEHRQQQSIVVVLSSWTVMCFNHRLELQWETSASRIQTVLGIGPLVQREVAILLSPVSITKDDHGVVVVGGSMMLRDGVDDGRFEISGDRVQEDTDGSDSEDYAGEVLLQRSRDEYYSKVKRAEQFNYFAFDGRTGAVRWKHEDGPSMEQEDVTADNMDVGSKENGYRMTKSDLRYMNAVGENNVGSGQSNEGDRTTMDWKEFRSSVLRSLPHSWSERDDTSLSVAHFDRDRHHRRSARWTSHLSSSSSATASATAAAAKANSKYPSGRKSSDAMGYAGVGGMGSRSGSGSGSGDNNDSKHASTPNVIVAHTRRGLEILHLFTGRTVTRVPMPETRFGGGSGAYVDVDGDRVIDHIQGIPGLEDEVAQSKQYAGMETGAAETVESEEDDVSESVKQKGRNHGRSSHYNVPSCWVQTVSGIPPLEQIWEGSLCDNRGGSSKGNRNKGRMAHAAAEPSHQIRDHLQHEARDSARVVPPIFLPHHGKVQGRPRAVRPYDVIMLVSTGVMTKYSPTGHRMWRTMTDAQWHRDPSTHWKTPRDVDAFTPSTVAMHLNAHGSNDNGHSSSNNKWQTHHDLSMIVGAGDTHLVVVSARSGAQIGRVELAAPPTGHLVVNDFNNDGLNDVIVVTREGVYGYACKTVARTRFPFIMLIFALVMISFLILLQVSGLLRDVNDDDDRAGGRKNLNNSGRWRGHNLSGMTEVKAKSRRAMD